MDQCKRAVVLVFTAFLARAYSQPGVQQPAFEVASVKRVPQAFMPVEMRETPTGIRYSSVTLADVVRRAYQLESFQLLNFSVLGGPMDVYDIVANFPAGARKDDIPAMLQRLLVERFHLIVHRETRETAVYALVIDNSGFKLKPRPTPDLPEKLPAPRSVAGKAGRLHLEGVMSLGDLSRLLSGATRRYMGRPVVDTTGVKGEFDIVLDAQLPMPTVDGEPERLQLPGGKTIEGDAPMLSSALLKIGLLLQPRRLPFEYVVVDKVSKEPTEN